MLAWLVVVVVIALAALAHRRFAWGYPAPRRALRRLAARDAAFLDAAAEAMFPAGGAIPVSGIEADVAGYVDDSVDRLPAPVRRQIRLLLILFEQATIVFPGRGRGGRRRFSSLDVEQRVAVLRGWTQSRFFLRRFVFISLRALLTMGYLAHPAVARSLGVAPYAIDSPICEADLLYPRIGEHPDSIPYGPEDLTAPSDGTPLDLAGPLHPDFAEPAS